MEYVSLGGDSSGEEIYLDHLNAAVVTFWPTGTPGFVSVEIDFDREQYLDLRDAYAAAKGVL
jgi:hypothetical protein